MQRATPGAQLAAVGDDAFYPIGIRAVGQRYADSRGGREDLDRRFVAFPRAATLMHDHTKPRSPRRNAAGQVVKTDASSVLRLNLVYGCAAGSCRLSWSR